MTKQQRNEEMEYFFDLMTRCCSSAEANLSKRDGEMAGMLYRISRCIYLLLEESRKQSKGVSEHDLS